MSSAMVTAKSSAMATAGQKPRRQEAGLPWLRGAATLACLKGSSLSTSARQLRPPPFVGVVGDADGLLRPDRLEAGALTVFVLQRVGLPGCLSGGGNGLKVFGVATGCTTAHEGAACMVDRPNTAAAITSPMTCSGVDPLSGLFRGLRARTAISAHRCRLPPATEIFVRHYRELALGHPHTVVLLATRPLTTPLGLGTHHSLAPLESILSLLTTAGFLCPRLFRGIDSFCRFCAATSSKKPGKPWSGPTKLPDRLSLAVRRLPADRFPILSTHPPIITGYDGARELERGLDVLLRGLG